MNGVFLTTRSTEELGGFDEAVAAAIAELEGESPSQDEPTAEPLADDQAEVELTEQAEGTEESATPTPGEGEELEELFDVEEEESREQQQSVTEISPDELEVEVPGVEEPVPLRELIDGYLRQSDYTRKTQQLADQRKQYEDAIRLWEALQEDPVGVVRRLGVEAGLMEAGAEPVKQLEFSPFKTADAVEAELARRVEEAVASHPAVVEAQMVQAREWMESSFSDIEAKYDVKLGPKSRKAILLRAQENGTANLELVFQAMWAEKQARAAKADGLRAAAPSRSTGRTTEKQVTDPADSIEEAFSMAEVSLGVRG